MVQVRISRCSLNELVFSCSVIFVWLESQSSHHVDTHPNRLGFNDFVDALCRPFRMFDVSGDFSHDDYCGAEIH